MLKDWIRRLSGAGGVEYRLGQAHQAGQRERQTLQRDLAAIAAGQATLRDEHDALRADNAALRDTLARVEQRLGHVSRFGVAAVWHAIDRIDALSPPRALTCLACAHADEAHAFATRRDHCIFGGGLLIRHECPRCGCVFGPTKYLDLPPALIDLDYTQLYAGYAEGDSTQGEIATFHALRPKPGGRYLNWGSGAWSGAIDALRAQGHDVWGYEPNAGIDHPHVLRTREAVQGPYDGIFSHNVIEHLLDPAAQFAEFTSLLAQDGVMAHASPCYEWAFPFTRFHVFFPMGTAPQALAARTGFAVTDAQDDGDFRVRVFGRV